MKRVLIIVGIVIAVLVVAFFSLKSLTKSKSPEAVAQISHDGLNVRVDYCQPYMKGRKIFGGLVPYDSVWRTGANEATLIKFDQDVTVSGQPLKAGQYSFWTIPTANVPLDKPINVGKDSIQTLPAPGGWTAIFNRQTGQWGTMYDKTQNVLRVPMTVRTFPTPIEQFKIEMAPRPNGADMVLGWEQTEAILPIRKQ